MICYEFDSKVATLNLLTLSINYQAILPFIWDMKTVIFVSSSVYYTASSDIDFHKDNAIKVDPINAGKFQGIVYTSDLSLS